MSKKPRILGSPCINGLLEEGKTKTMVQAGGGGRHDCGRTSGAGAFVYGGGVTHVGLAIAAGDTRLI
jgi:hypothetical protein